MFNNTKIERYELYKTIKEKVDSKKDFDLIDDFKDSIKGSIYTDITMSDHTESLEKAFQSRLQILQSETLLRSLMLKEGMVVALNNNNFPAYYASLKSFLEIPAVLGYITHFIHNSTDYENIIQKIGKLHLGNREAGMFPTGDVQAVNVLTMFERLDQVFNDVACDGKTEKECVEIIENENLLSSTYADVCNFGHTNFNANLSIGILNGDTWKAKTDSSGYKNELWFFYMPGFLVGMTTIKILNSLIDRNDKVQNYSLMKSPQYFD